ncbi:hypothetical protein CC80DRAFT_176931 [Byssothecium circinans]|uniref:DUF7605 domain-containing protein n=1 Tax=Byssothecium circinans TaxID=147558 RepID=A0A6A5TIB4_9PLEO|nr:hypothetical protein CC80DRAFT_176931 [Byssothecium circinans]
MDSPKSSDGRESPLFEPSQEGFGLESTSLFPEPDLSMDVPPVAHMYSSPDLKNTKPAINCDEDGSKKRKRAVLHPEIAAYLERLTQEYNQLDPDGKTYHSPASEPLPQLPAYHDAFPKAEKMSMGIVRKLQETVIMSGEEDHESKYMQDCLAQIAAPTNPGLRMLCLSGNCGVGKSSLINAILGVEGASLKAGDGGSGTLVPIELVQAPEKQPFPYAAYVFYYPLQMCEDIVRMWLANYFDARIAPPEECLKDISSIDLGKPALKVFLALFHDHIEFEDEVVATRFLAKAKSRDDPKILAKLLAWTKHIHAELTKLGSVIQIQAHTASDLNHNLEPFSQHCVHLEIRGTSLECSVFPFVNRVRKSLFNPILAKGIMLVDLPDISDSDQQRVRLTAIYFKHCHQAIVVHSIERAEDDRHLEEIILDIYRRKRSGSVAVVLSRSDDVEREPRMKYTPQQQAHLDSLDLYEDEVETKLKTMRKRSRIEYDARQYSELMNKEGLLQYLLKHAKTRYIEILVQARNDKVRTNLQAWYRSATSDPSQLQVFCVSSKCYMAHVKGTSPLEPLLSVAMTEIPLVRSYLFQLAGNGGKVNALRHHYVQIRSLLSQMELSCNGFKPMMKRDHLLKMVAVAQKGVGKSFDTVHQELYKSSITPIVVKFSTEDSWSEKAGVLCEKWSRYTSLGHAAFMKHEGNWKTAACGRANWNACLLDIVRADIQPLLDQLHCDASYAFKTDAMEAMSELVDSMEQDIKDNLDCSQLDRFKGFFDSLRDRKKTMSNILEAATNTMQDQILKLNNDTLNDGPQSPLTLRMAKIYQASLKAPQEKLRRTKHAARCAYFRHAVCTRKTGPYLSIRRYLEKGFKQIMDNVDVTMRAKCEKILDAIMHDFNNVCPEHEDTGVQALRRREKLGKKVQEARDELEGPLMKTLLECGIERE